MTGAQNAPVTKTNRSGTLMANSGVRSALTAGTVATYLSGTSSYAKPNTSTEMMISSMALMLLSVSRRTSDRSDTPDLFQALDKLRRTCAVCRSTALAITAGDGGNELAIESGERAGVCVTAALVDDGV